MELKQLEDIHAIVGIPVKFIHITRNPFDNIATKVLRSLGTRDVASGEKVNQIISKFL